MTKNIGMFFLFFGSFLCIDSFSMDALEVPPAPRVHARREVVIPTLKQLAAEVVGDQLPVGPRRPSHFDDEPEDSGVEEGQAGGAGGDYERFVAGAIGRVVGYYEPPKEVAQIVGGHVVRFVDVSTVTPATFVFADEADGENDAAAPWLE